MAVAGARDSELPFSVSEALSDKARATAELHQALDTTLTPSRESSKIAQLKMYIKILEYNVPLCEDIEKSLKSKRLAAATKCTRLHQVSDSVCA